MATSTPTEDMLVSEEHEQQEGPESISVSQLKADLIRSSIERERLEARYREERTQWEERFSRMEALMKSMMSGAGSSQGLAGTTTAPTPQQDGPRDTNGAVEQPVQEARKDSDLAGMSVKDVNTDVPHSGQNINVPIDPQTRDRISVQVEHLVRSDRDHTIQHRLRPFSGNAPKNGEVDFDEWVRQVELVMEDKSCTDYFKRQKILSSLHTPALDLARSLGEVSASELYKHLVGLYGSTANGVKLLHDFFKMSPGQHERPTDFLQRLGVKLNHVVKKGGMQASQIDETLLTHFKAMCQDERLTNVLHVKFEVSKPPSFQELMKEVKRIEELGSTHKREVSRPKNTQAFTHTATDPVFKMQERMDKFEQNVRHWTDSISQSINKMNAHQVAEVHSIPAERHVPSNSENDQLNSNFRRSGQRQFRPREQEQFHPREQRRHYDRRQTAPSRKHVCFNCGSEDGHWARDCRNPPNPALVHQRLNAYNPQNPQSQHLNGNRPSHQ